MTAHGLSNITVITGAGIVVRGEQEGHRAGGAERRPRHKGPEGPLRDRALAGVALIEETTGWPIRKFVRTLRVYREGDVTVDGHHIATAMPLEEDASTAVETIRTRVSSGHQLHPRRGRIGRPSSSNSATMIPDRSARHRGLSGESRGPSVCPRHRCRRRSCTRRECPGTAPRRRSRT